jgi:hypothetical protein
MITVSKLHEIKKGIKSQLKSGNLELVVLPRIEYEALLEKLDDLKDIHDSLESMREYQLGKFISFSDYDTRRKARRV